MHDKEYGFQATLYSYGKIRNYSGTQIIQGHNININNNTFHLQRTFVLLKGFYIHYHIYIGHRSNSTHASNIKKLNGKLLQLKTENPRTGRLYYCTENSIGHSTHELSCINPSASRTAGFSLRVHTQYLKANFGFLQILQVRRNQDLNKSVQQLSAFFSPKLVNDTDWPRTGILASD